jgi:hypothetical protein
VACGLKSGDWRRYKSNSCSRTFYLGYSAFFTENSAQIIQAGLIDAFNLPVTDV